MRAVANNWVGCDALIGERTPTRSLIRAGYDTNDKFLYTIAAIFPKATNCDHSGPCNTIFGSYPLMPTHDRNSSLAVGVDNNKMGSTLSGPQLRAGHSSYDGSSSSAFAALRSAVARPFGEPVVHRPEASRCIVGTGLIAQQSGKARGGAQFPRERALPARPVERLSEVTLGRRRGSRRVLHQKKLALDAQQLGSCPAFFGALGADDRLLDRGEPVVDLPGTTQGLCHKERKDTAGRTRPRLVRRRRRAAAAIR